MESARPASAADIGTLTELWARARQELTHEKGGTLLLSREAAALDPAAWFNRDDRVALAGLYDDVVVGFALATLETLATGQRLARVDALYVEPDARAVGVGEALFDHIVEWAQRARCAGIDAMVLPGMRDSKNFFEAHGLTARAIVVHRDL